MNPEQIRSWRYRHCWTQIIAAAMLNVSVHEFQRWESYGAKIPADLRQRMDSLDKEFPPQS